MSETDDATKMKMDKERLISAIQSAMTIEKNKFEFHKDIYDNMVFVYSDFMRSAQKTLENLSKETDENKLIFMIKTNKIIYQVRDEKEKS